MQRAIDSGVSLIRYLDISSTNLSASAFKYVIRKISEGKLCLKVLECRKNNLDGALLHDECFLLLKSESSSLQCIDLKDNKLDNECALDLLAVCSANISFHHVFLEDNRRVHNDTIDEIDAQCQMNFLIQKFIVPTLPQVKSHKSGKQPFSKYDTSVLELHQEYFFRLNFVVKFLKIMKETCHKLVLQEI